MNTKVALAVVSSATVIIALVIVLTMAGPLKTIDFNPEGFKAEFITTTVQTEEFGSYTVNVPTEEDTTDPVSVPRDQDYTISGNTFRSRVRLSDFCSIWLGYNAIDQGGVCFVN